MFNRHFRVTKDCLNKHIISEGKSETAVNILLTYYSYLNVVLNHRYAFSFDTPCPESTPINKNCIVSNLDRMTQQQMRSLCVSSYTFHTLIQGNIILSYICNTVLQRGADFIHFIYTNSRYYVRCCVTTAWRELLEFKDAVCCGLI